MAVKTKAEVESALAQAAWQQGEALLVAGDAAAARRWLDRAARIAPDDDTVALSLAQVLLALGDPAAAPKLAELASRHDVREIWLALAGARLRQGDTAGAAAALAMSLSGHRLPDPAAVADLSGLIAARAAAPGWCGLCDDDTVHVRLGDPALGVAVLLADGAPLPDGIVPAAAAAVSVMVQGRHLLGSPLRAARIRRVDGFVAATQAGIAGWAWLPHDAGREAVLHIAPVAGGAAMLRVTARDTAHVATAALTRPRGFAVAASDLPPGPLRVRGPDGRDLTGSPLDPAAEHRAAAAAARAVAAAIPAVGPLNPQALVWTTTAADLAAPPAAAPAQPRRRLAVVVPAYRGAGETLACLHAVFATVPSGTSVIVVDDASPEPELAAALDGLAGQGRIVLLRNPRNLGFPGAANAGLRAAAALPAAPDVVLLNSDTLPTAGWLALLRAAVHAAPDIGTACPLSNDAAILSYPDPEKPAAAPAGPALAALAALAARVHGRTVVDIPTAVGFCMYLRRECLLQTGLFREDLFGQGYGEENDFCVRARHLGWRHVAVPGAYVAHLGGRSFGASRAHLMARNLALLERLHPGYQAMIAAWTARDPLAEPRRALDIARLRAEYGARGRADGAVVLVTHDSGGGVERAVRARCAELRRLGLAPILLRPVLDLSKSAAAADRRYLPGRCGVGDDGPARYPNLRFRLPDELAGLAALLAAARPRAVELHHLLGHHASIADLPGALRVPYDLRVHDYAMICARINLVGAERRYCGEPPVSGCAACVADLGSALEDDIAPAGLRARSAAIVAGARGVVTPSQDAAARLRRYFPAARPVARPHEEDATLPPAAPLAPASASSGGGGPRRIGLIGAIGAAKGYDVLLACARDAAQRDLAVSFTVLGHTEDDERLLATGRVFITGPYHERDAVTLIKSHALHLAWLPSVIPETWCYVMGEAFRAGLGVAAFDLGAQAERIRATGRGWLLPLGLPPAAINNALLALRTVAGDDYAATTGDIITINPRSITARV